jgi:hypothetical protein
MCYENKCDLYLCRLLRRSSLLLRVLSCIRISASIYRQFKWHTCSMTGRCPQPQKFQKGDGVCWVMRFRIRWCGWLLWTEDVCLRGCACSGWSWAPFYWKDTGNRHFVLGCISFQWQQNDISGQKRKKKAQSLYWSGLGRTCLAQSEWKSLKSRFRLMTVSRLSAQMRCD